MKLLTNPGSNRVIDILKAALTQGGSLDAIAPSLSLFAYEPLAKTLAAFDLALLSPEMGALLRPAGLDAAANYCNNNNDVDDDD